MKTKPKNECIALIPARSGSQRVPGKNIKLLKGHPLIAYTIRSAIRSKVFKRVIVSTNSPVVAAIAIKYGAEVPFLRPPEFATGTSPDIEWIKYTLARLKKEGETAKYFSILRPTSPFRQPETIQRAWKTFLASPSGDSLRAVEPTSQHPAKMWYVRGKKMEPVMKNPNKHGTPWHSMPTQSLPQIYVQNASLEISRFDVPLKKGTIAGANIIPFFTKEHEGFDINKPEDWIVAVHLVKKDSKLLPEI